MKRNITTVFNAKGTKLTSSAITRRNVSTQHFWNPSTMQMNSEASLATLKPELYVASNRWQWRQNLLALERFQKSFKRDAQGEEQYLDLGCGTGDFTRECLLPCCLPCRRIVA
ncbi:unnamed protein product, partial [Ixodes pacificus]